MRKCGDCAGTGSLDKKPTTCGPCKGSGTQVRLQRFPNGMAVQQQVTCPQCSGVGRRPPARPCNGKGGCGGKGYAVQKKRIKLEIKKGMADGEAFRFEGDGDETEHFAEAGDVLIVLEELPHPYFRRLTGGSGRDLVVRGVKVPLLHALQGLEVPIQHLDGRIVLAKTDRLACFQPSYVHYVRNCGMPDAVGASHSTARLYLDVEVVYPRIVKGEKERAAEAAKGKTNVITMEQLDVLREVLAELSSGGSSSSSAHPVPTDAEIAASNGRIVAVKLVNHEYGEGATKGQFASAAGGGGSAPSEGASASAGGGAGGKKKAQQQQQQQQQQRGSFTGSHQRDFGRQMPGGMPGGVHVQECNQQ